MLVSVAVFAQDVYTQDFESGVPDGWTATGEWQLTDAAGISSQYFMPEEHTTFMGVNDDGLGAGVSGNGTITTGAIDLADATGVLVLSIESFFPNGDYQGADEKAIINISTDEGATWTQLADLEEVGGFAWNNVLAPLSDYAGQTIWLQFDYVDGDEWNYGWCIDDIRIGAAIERDASVTAGGLLNGGLVGLATEISGTITNNGVNPINSIDVNWSDGTTTYTETMMDLDIPLQGTMAFTHSDAFSILDGTTDISIWVSNVNGMGDDENTGNDMTGLAITGVTPHPERAVVVEEATGTWCTWCPRGAAFLDGMSERYGDAFIGIAVHNNDPMAVAAYDGAITGFPNFTGFPSVVYQRESIMDPSDIEGPSATDMLEAPIATLVVGSEWDDATRDLTTSVTATFNEAVSGDYRLALVATETGVTGTGEGWDQINAYAGGGQGPMGGYENLPNPIPGNIMVYNHVGRELIGGFDGVAGSLPDAIAAGETDGHVFDTYTIPADYDTEKMHLVAILVAPNGQIANAKSVTIADAVANGITNVKDTYRNDLAKVYPNPTSYQATIELSLETSSDVLVEAFNAVGQRVNVTDYGTLAGTNVLTFDTSNLANGVYSIHIKLDNANIIKKITVQK